MEINKDTVLIINKKKYTMDAFMDKYGILDMDKAIEIAGTLVKQGRAIIDKKTSPEEEMLKAAHDEDLLDKIANQIETEKENYVKAQRQQKLEDSDKMKIALDFVTTIDASKFENWVNSLGVDDTEIRSKQGQIKLVINDISSDEYAKIARKYQLENAVKKTVDVSNDLMSKVNDGFAYATTEILVPLGTVSEQVMWGVGKTAVHAATKAGASLINTGAKAYVETKTALATDPELIQAKAKLNQAKNGLIKFIKGKTGAKAGGGISVIED